MHRMPIPWYSGPTGQFMRLNVLVVLIFTLLALTEDVASPQQPQKVHRIGWIAFNGSRPPRDFMIGLRERGYIEGQSIIIEYRSAQGSEKRLSEIAAELVRLKPEVIVANGNDATDAARKATTTIPIVFEHGDPVWDGVVGSLAQPGKNLTGLSASLSSWLGSGWSCSGTPFQRSPVSPCFWIQMLPFTEDSSLIWKRWRRHWVFSFKLWSYEIRGLILTRSCSGRLANAPMLFSHCQTPLFFGTEGRLEFAAKNRLPAIYPNSAFANAGGLMSYGLDYRAFTDAPPIMSTGF